MLRAVVLCVVVAAVVAEPVPGFKDCGSKSGKINSLDITPCASFPCQFPRGKNVSVSIVMTANSQVTAATTVVHGIIDDLPVSFPVPNPNACTDMTCPIPKAAEVTYNNAIFVQETYPKIRLLVKWEIQDQTKQDFICFEVPAEIVD